MNVEEVKTMLTSKSNRNLKIKLIPLLLILMTVFSILSYSIHAKSGANVDMEDNYSFVKILLNKDGAIGKINGYLLPQRRINLLDINSEVVAEYIEFQNESREYVGYIITDVHSGHIYDYSNEGNLFEGLLIKSELTYDDVLAGKVYFVNPFEIYVELTDGRIIDLMPQSGINSSEITRSQLEQTFSLRQVEYKSPIEPELKSLEVLNTTLMRSASFTPCVTSDFNNLKIVDANGRRVYPHDHCSPTAATTIMKYFKHLGESNLSSSYSNNDVFAKFYIAMDTNGGASGTEDEGTARSKIAPSYTKVGRDLGAKPRKSSKLSGTSSNRMISALNGGKLLHVSVDKLGSSKGGHSIAIVSYSNGYFKIADGWSAYFRNVSYSDMSVKQVVGINY